MAAILSLALGVGANTAAFSALQAGLAPRLAWKNPAELIFVGRKDASYPMLSDTLPVSYPRFQLWQAHQQVLDPLAAWARTPSIIGGPIEPRSVQALRVSPEYWPMLGVQPALGRLPIGDETGVMVASHKLWMTALGGDKAMIGKSFLVDGRALTLIGVVPPAAVWLGSEIFVPLDPTEEERAGNMNFLSVTGRMRAGLGEADVQAAFQTLNAQLQSGVASERTMTAVPRPLLQTFYGRTFLERQKLLGWVALFVTALACVNLCILMLGRGASRIRELSIRQALGATRGQLFAPLFSDLLLAAVPGLALGCVFSLATGRLMSAFVPGDFEIFHVPSLTDFGIASAVALFLALAGAGLPAIVIPRMAAFGIQVGARTSGGPARQWTQKGLVALQVGLALVLLSSFALVYQSLRRLEAAPIGIQVDGRVLATLFLPTGNPSAASRRQAEVAHVLEVVRALPGVEAAGGTDLLPVISGGGYNGRMRVPGHSEPVFTYFRGATDGYFETAGIPLMQGRTFRPSDIADPPRVLIVSQSFARDYFPGQDALGREIPFGDASVTIVGVVGDTRMDNIRQVGNTQTIYTPTAVHNPRFDLVVKTAGSPDALLPDLRRILRAQWPDVSLDKIRSIADAVDLQNAGDVRRTALMGVLAGLALVLTLAGIYGVLNRQVLERRKEMGIRLALGGRGAQITALVVRQAMTVVGVGLVAGTGGALALGGVLQSQLYEVQSRDPRIHLAAALVLAAAALLACLVPALRAASADPARVLRDD